MRVTHRARIPTHVQSCAEAPASAAANASRRGRRRRRRGRTRVARPRPRPRSRTRTRAAVHPHPCSRAAHTLSRAAHTLSRRTRSPASAHCARAGVSAASPARAQQLQPEAVAGRCSCVRSMASGR
eukprot:6181650-Pleurochrysis_carterae.AAC.2